MTECYTELALAGFDKLKAELDNYKALNYSSKDRCWFKQNNSGHFVKCNSAEIEVHQSYVRNLKQRMENLGQDSLVEFFSNSISSKPISQEIQELYNQIAPLVYRRRNFDIVKSILGFSFNPDGELFTFSDPVKIKTTYLYCGCGHIMKSAEEMTESEALLAEEHLKVCQYPLEQIKEELSVVSKHTIGHWNCRACYNEPTMQIQTGTVEPFSVASSKSATLWCPKFLRPFRNNTPLEYLKQVKGSKSCYAGILHKQISISLEKSGKQYLVIEELCDTCGYGRSIKSEIQVPEQTKQTLAK